MLRAFCGPKAFPSVIFVTTFWDESGEKKGNQRQDQLRTMHIADMLCAGAHLHRFEGTSASAWEIINQLPFESGTFAIQEEICQGKKFQKTAAAARLGAKANSGLTGRWFGWLLHVFTRFV